MLHIELCFELSHFSFKLMCIVYSNCVVAMVTAMPEMILPLQDQHLDVGTRQLTWRCEARAVPFPQYAWYKNGVLLTNSSNSDVTLFRNTLILRNLNKERDEGMYQCLANNTHGEVVSTAQLRILCKYCKNP